MSEMPNAKRKDFSIIASMIRNHSTVLDLGCGDGSLLAHLKQSRNVTGYGVEKDDANVLASLQNGISVIQSDLEEGLAEFGDGAFEYVILSLTLQAVHETEAIIREMLRVGNEVIVTFPNFGYWRHRLQLFLGKAPISKELPFQWYDTPNVHVLTLHDFESFCSAHDVRILEKVVLNENYKRVRSMQNLVGSLAIYRFNQNA